MAEINLLEIEESHSRNYLTKPKEIKRIIEGLLFSSSDPISIEKMKEIIATLYPIKKKDIKIYIDELNDEYFQTGRAFQIDEVGVGYLLRTTEEVAPYVTLLHQNRRAEKLSHAATEVLAIVAYRAPITRSEIDALRGVDSSGTLATLIERGLVEAIGKRESAAGKPMEYSTTEKFLKYFGIKDLDSLKRV